MHNTVTAKTSKQTEISSLLIPMQGDHIILPNVTVAEIISYKSPRPRASAPAWYLGTLEWRSTVIPVISFEDANAETSNINSSDARIAIINGVGENKRMPFYALVVQGIPRLVHVAKEDMTPVEEASGPATLMVAKVGEDTVRIPDLQHLETLLLSMGGF